jgi:hypothetical protein
MAGSSPWRVRRCRSRSTPRSWQRFDKSPGDGNLSAFVNEVLRWHLQNIRLRGYLNLLEEEFGRMPEELREEARREWDALKSSWNEDR